MQEGYGTPQSIRSIERVKSKADGGKTAHTEKGSENMTAKQAMKEGLVFTGFWVYTYGKVEALIYAKQTREKYKCRAVLVNTDGGIAVFADKKYSDLKRAEHLEALVNNIPAKRQKLLEQIEELEKEEIRLLGQIAQIRALYIEK